jgi:hypothetical protein
MIVEVVFADGGRVEFASLDLAHWFAEYLISLGGDQSAHVEIS